MAQHSVSRVLLQDNNDCMRPEARRNKIDDSAKTRHVCIGREREHFRPQVGTEPPNHGYNDYSTSLER
jgi:hypothetical protein